ncbi:MAG: hypothetical protein K5792_11890 [Butyrivibrio sp.]|nr:hypothetical protein [Butyrivibrio sp.]
MFTTSLYTLQKNNPSTFAVMMTKRQRRKLSEYLKNLQNDFDIDKSNNQYSTLTNKLENGYMSYNDTELKLMRAAITWNRFYAPLSFILQKYMLRTVNR